MDEQGQAQTTRRAALRGIGIAAGAVALGAGIDLSEAMAEESSAGLLGADGEPLTSGGSTQGGEVPAAITTGLTYLTFSQFAFRPNLHVNGYRTSGNGAYCDITGGAVVANLPLPSGAVIKEAQFVGQNSSVGTAMFLVERYLTFGGSSELVARVDMPPGGANLQTHTATLSHSVDADYSYCATVLTGNPVRIHSCRIGYAGSFGFFPLNPQVRKLDTRSPGPLSGKFLAGQTRVLTLTPQLPAGAAAALLNVTVTNTVNGGFLTLYPATAADPGTSSINWFGSGQTLANNATVAVSSAGQIKILCGGAGGPQADVIIDLLGYLR